MTPPADAPEPLVDKHVVVREFPYMPLDIQRLMTSDTWIIAAKDGKIGHALICLWCESWRSIPAASLPNNDIVLARLAMCDEDDWKRIKGEVMSKFILCSDNRFYHPVVAEKAIIAWNEKLARQNRTRRATVAAAAERKKERKKNPKKQKLSP